MTRTLYALLVGIDRYQPPVAPLAGCVADIDAMEAFLRARVPDCRIETLRNEQATYAAVTQAFGRHLGQAGKDDVALFCYSGHGSQAPTAPEFWHLEPDRLDETLVCFDSRQPGRHDLADKELSKLIADVAKREPHIVVLLDACHSGSVTREARSEGVRRAPADNRPRPAQSYLAGTAEFQGVGGNRSATAASSGWVRLPRGRHVLMSACQSDEEAKEIRFGDRMHGVFSYFLLQALQGTSAEWTYRDLYARVHALVRSRVARQVPLIEASDLQDLDRPFLGGAVRPHAPYFTLRRGADGWMIDGGAIHGIAPTAGAETTHLAVYPAQAEDFEDRRAALGTARVTRVEPARSQVELAFDDGRAIDPEATYKAIITALPLPVLGVRMQGSPAALGAVRAALLRAGPDEGPSLLVRECEEGEDLLLLAGEDGRYRIRRAGDDRPLYAIIDDEDADARAVRAVSGLEHIARWMRIANLANPTSRISPDTVKVEVLRLDEQGQWTPVDHAASGAGLRLDYEYRDGEWHEPMIRLRLRNTGRRRLYCMLLDLTDRFKVSAALLPGGGVWLDAAPANVAWAFDGEAIPVSMPDELWRQGLTEYKDLLKLVVCTDECNATLFEQESLEMRFEARGRNAWEPSNTLERLAARVHFREVGPSGGQDRLPDWTTCEIALTTVRPQPGTQLTGGSGRAAIAPRVAIRGHAKFEATARLASAPLAARDMTGAPPLPVWLHDDPTVVQPLQLAESRSAEAGLSVLELTAVSAPEAVTPEQPLVVEIEATLRPDEHVLPIAYDPDAQCYVPIGRARASAVGLEIRLEQLPNPAADARSLTGSIKIFFEKVVRTKLGIDLRYPLLGTLDAAGIYCADLDEVRRRVDGARRILLYVHGIIGDTHDMAASAYQGGPQWPSPPETVGARYDLVLTFDYENLNTSIEATARALKERLSRVGLAPGHGKTLHVVAHSMGGLVSRWFIERDGGHEVVQHLVMLGTPNGGSPWPTVQDWAFAAIGLGLNGLTRVAWPAKVLGSLVSAAESIDVTLDQMAPGSDLLAGLASSGDPRVPYTILAGNTSLVAAALVPEPGQELSRIKKLFRSLRLRPALYKAASLAFFGHPNDVAASVDSVCAVPAKRERPPVLREVACDHMSYFTTEAGLSALAAALPREEP